MSEEHLLAHIRDLEAELKNERIRRENIEVSMQEDIDALKYAVERHRQEDREHE